MTTQRQPNHSISRRQFLKSAGAVGVAAIGPLGHVAPARAAKKTLRILQWSHFVPGYDKWFNDDYIKTWGAKNDTEVIVDNIGVAMLNSRASAEVAAQKGHDLVLFLSPPPVFEEQVVDMSEIHQEVARKYGPPVELAIKSTFNPKTKKYFAFSDSFVPDPVNFRQDLWDDVGVAPDSWESIRVGGRQIKQRHNIPVGIGLSSELDSSMALRALMYSFGAGEQDADNRLAIRSPQTLEALKFAKSLFQEAMTPEVLAWDPSSNNRAMLAGRLSLVLNAISITREGENQQMPIHQKIALAPPLAGPVRRIGLEHVMNCYVIWKFAENIAGAKQFLLDYIDNFQHAFRASEFYNFPCYSKTVPDLEQVLARDVKAVPVTKYQILTQAQAWSTNVGYPGFANAAVDEAWNTWIIPTLFAKVATGAESPEDALKWAEAKMKPIWEKWQEKGLL